MAKISRSTSIDNDTGYITTTTRKNGYSKSVTKDSSGRIVKSGASREYTTPSISIIGKIILLIIVAVPVLQVLFNGSASIMDIDTILRILSECPSIPMDWFGKISSGVILGDWGAFDFLRNFFNTGATFFSFIGWIFSGVINSLLVVTYFFGQVIFV